MLKGFKAFVMRGNVIDLAVAVVLGAAFTAVVNAVVKGLITPVIAAVFGKPDLTQVGNFTINNAQFSLGLILDALFNFLIIAAAVYFIIVLPVNKLLERLARAAGGGAGVPVARGAPAHRDPRLAARSLSHATADRTSRTADGAGASRLLAPSHVPHAPPVEWPRRHTVHAPAPRPTVEWQAGGRRQQAVDAVRRPRTGAWRRRPEDARSRRGSRRARGGVRPQRADPPAAGCGPAGGGRRRRWATRW